MVKGLPKISFKKNQVFCDSCTQGKQTRKFFKTRTENLSTKPLELIHMDLFGPTRSVSLSGRKYGYVLVDDFSRYTWVFFLTHKHEAFSEFQVFYKKIEQEGKYKISNLQSDHGGEFQNTEFDQFCRTHGINHKFSSPRIP